MTPSEAAVVALLDRGGWELVPRTWADGTPVLTRDGVTVGHYGLVLGTVVWVKHKEVLRTRSLAVRRAFRFRMRVVESIRAREAEALLLKEATK